MSDERLPDNFIGQKGQHAGDLPQEAGGERPIVESDVPLFDYAKDARVPDDLNEGFKNAPLNTSENPIVPQSERHTKKRNLGIVIGGIAASVVAAGALFIGNANSTPGNENTPPAPEPNASAPETPGATEQPVPAETEAPVTPEQPGETLEFQSPELEARYNEVVDSVRVPVAEFPDPEAAYAEIAENIGEWAALKPSDEDIAQFNDYTSDRQTQFNGSAGVIIDIDREAYIDTMFVGNNGGALAEEINKFNTMLIGNYDQTYNDATRYDLSYELLDTPVVQSTIDENVFTTNATYAIKDNVVSEDRIGQARIANGDEPTINETQSIAMELVAVGEGADAEWKIQNARIINRN